MGMSTMIERVENCGQRSRRAMRKRHLKGVENYNQHSKELPELNENECVAVQNQDGNHPNRWDRTGKVIEKLPHRQYRVKMDISNRVTLRNRRFLRKIDPVCSDESTTDITFQQLSPRISHMDTGP